MSVKELPSAKELWQTFDYDPLTGMITWRNDRFNICGRLMAEAGSEAGSVNGNGRGVIRLNQLNYYSHRIAWKMALGTEPPVLIDHIDRNPLNNAISNLAVAARIKENIK